METTQTAQGQIVDMVVTPFAESISEVTIGNWLKKDGEFVKLDENIVEIETDKATQEIPAIASGILKQIAKQGDILKIGDLICQIIVGVEQPQSQPQSTPQATQKQEVSTQTQTIDSYAKGHPSPAAAKIMAEKGLTPNDINGTGIGGRITKEDALRAEAKSTPQLQESKTQELTTSSTPPPTTGSRQQRRAPLSPLRRTIARRLVAVKNETAMLTTFNEVNMKSIIDLRNKYKDKFKEKYGVSLGFMSFFTKAVCIALQEFPAVNAMIDGNDIVYNDFCDISIAVSAPKGLVVPVLRNAERMSFAEIEKGIADLATKARENKLSIEEMQGGTFTITNGGVFGSLMSTPIINAPQSAILGMHNIVERPVAINGEVVIRPMMYVALSYDHRIIDGRESVGFLVRVKQILEAPESMLFGL
ncbi:MAG: 2-oxoglutarate dehydrogenase complex dihydrolipoyllysine-residue succinyltransferase [Microscillaceae bacterium]|nr:2-oxoglutarate dehydrogenase complex dihydrolipoyllysine-residue succinyltransferase [Microscillaceae bacterium]MDW8461795.1 2-oxoglutarate dehydrogenase complex dihydrolipoyllysine-residue succinyltransferase [Cytophagales bacterium]